MTNLELVKAITSGIPMFADGVETEVIGVDYHVVPDDTGNMIGFGGVVDRANTYHSIPIENLSCSADLTKVPWQQIPWKGIISSQEIVKMIKAKSPVAAGGRVYPRMMSLYLKKSPRNGELFYSAECLDKNGMSRIYEYVDRLTPVAS